MSLLSIVIPTYEALGFGEKFLERNLKQLKLQKFKDFEIVIADSVPEENVKKYLEKEKESIKDLTIKYVKVESPKTIYSNINEGIKNASGEFLHIMCMEDYFYNKHSLQRIVDDFDSNKGWLVSMYMHTKDGLGLFKQHIPAWNAQILSNNTIGCISCLSFVNNKDSLFDENVELFADTDFYYRLYKKYGLPKLLQNLIWVQTIWDGRVTKKPFTQENADAEMNYLNDKHLEKKVNA
jgi:glycosyltransferase involved in cell wall biosynthesis